MSKIAIVGVEGSGKTTLMAAFGEKYERPDRYGYGLKAENAQTFRLVKTLTAHMRQGRWPSATELGALTNLDWTLYRREGANVENICEVSFLDFAGEVYRKAFGGQSVDEAGMQQVAALREHVKGSNALVVLVNLKDIIDGDPASERTTDMLWVSQRILDFAIDTCKIGHVALAFSQFDIYRETVEAAGGLQAAYVKYLPHVEGVRPDLPLMALSAVDRTRVDADGYEVPAPDFASRGLEDLFGWIVSTVPGHENEIRERRELPQTLWQSLISARAALQDGNGSVSPDWMEDGLVRLNSLPADEREGVATEDEVGAMAAFVAKAKEGERRLAETLKLAQGGNFELALSELEKDVVADAVLDSRARAARVEIATLQSAARAEEARRRYRRNLLRGCAFGAVALVVVFVGGNVVFKCMESARLRDEQRAREERRLADAQAERERQAADAKERQERRSRQFARLMRLKDGLKSDFAAEKEKYGRDNGFGKRVDAVESALRQLDSFGDAQAVSAEELSEAEGLYRSATEARDWLRLNAISREKVGCLHDQANARLKEKDADKQVLALGKRASEYANGHFETAQAKLASGDAAFGEGDFTAAEKSYDEAIKSVEAGLASLRMRLAAEAEQKERERKAEEERLAKERAERLSLLDGLRDRAFDRKLAAEGLKCATGQRFGQWLAQLKDGFETGEKRYAAGDKDAAYAAFESAVKAADWILANAPLRDKAQVAKTQMEAEKRLAETAEAPKVAAPYYERACQVRDRAEEQFGGIDFVKACELFGTAGENFATARGKAEEAQKTLRLEQAETAAQAGEWRRCFALAHRVLKSDPEHKQAKMLAERAEDHFKLGEKWTVELLDGVTMNFIWVPRTDAKGVWFGETEVTQRQWQKVLEWRYARSPRRDKEPSPTPSHFRPENVSFLAGMDTSDFPVESVSYEDCKFFVETLRQLCPGYGFGMPSFAQRKAVAGIAKGGTRWLRKNSGLRDIQIDGYSLSKVREALIANKNRTHSVCEGAANSIGIFGFEGNVAEWCGDVEIKEGWCTYVRDRCIGSCWRSYESSDWETVLESDPPICGLRICF